MEKILRYYPAAKFVGIVRNPFGAIHSKRKYFPPKVPDQLAYLSAKWVEHLIAFENFYATDPGRALLVRYEDLVSDTKGSIESICCFLDIEFIPKKIVDYRREADRIILPSEKWKQDVKEAPICLREQNPKNIFTFSEILKIQSFTAEKMSQYGYKRYHALLQKFYDLVVMNF